MYYLFNHLTRSCILIARCPDPAVKLFKFGAACCAFCGASGVLKTKVLIKFVLIWETTLNSQNQLLFVQPFARHFERCSKLCQQLAFY